MLGKLACFEGTLTQKQNQLGMLYLVLFVVEACVNQECIISTPHVYALWTDGILEV
jgi:hypothetical protein